jgi:hypothetical protein
VITIRELHVLAFGERVGCWYDEACTIWNEAYAQPGEPPVLLLAGGGYAHYGRALADAGPREIDGRLTRYQIRLFSNEQTKVVTTDDQDRRDLIAHELGHVYQCVVFGKIEKGKPSTHASPSWRAAIVQATPYLLPQINAIVNEANVSLAAVFAGQEHRIRRNPQTKQVERYRDPHAIPVDMLSRWPHSFRGDEGMTAFVRVVEDLARRNDPVAA